MDVKQDMMLISLGIIILLISIFGQINAYSDSSENKSTRRSLYYVCPPEFIRMGQKCYYFSTTPETWQDAHFGCKDRDSNLTAPYRWEDRNLRNFLTKPDTGKHERWLGGRYDWMAKAWKWGGETREMKYQSFQRVSHRSPEDLQWHCIAMIPEYDYRWDARSCLEKKHYICQSTLQRIEKSERDRLRIKWKNNKNGFKPNEIPVPKSIKSPETKKPKYNPKPKKHLDSNSIPSTEMRFVPNALKKSDNNRQTPINYNIQHKPKGSNRTTNRQRYGVYSESAYIHNLNALKSGKTGMTIEQINRNLKRLERLRKREENQRKRAERLRDRQNRERNEINRNDLNVLSNVSRNISSRNIKEDKKNRKKSRTSKKLDNINFKHSIDNVTQRTYLEDNQISELHPKTIVEVHDFSV